MNFFEELQFKATSSDIVWVDNIINHVCMSSLSFSGLKCSRSCAAREYCPPKGEEATEELQEMDVHCNYHPSYHCCNHCCGRNQAVE